MGTHARIVSWSSAFAIAIAVGCTLIIMSPSAAARPCPDADGDSVCNNRDNCPAVYNQTQENYDGDAFGDACDSCTDSDSDGFGNPGFPVNTCSTDNCPTLANPTQANTDGDAFGDACDSCTDTDNDGFGNPGFPANTCTTDNCPTLANSTQTNGDGDAYGDACDTCTDTDSDSFGNPGFPANTCTNDNCPTLSNPTQANTDGDALGDACDVCPYDPQNDVDGDGRCESVDNCDTVYNPTQADDDADAVGSACDNCPANTNPGQENGDGDALGNICDPCPVDPGNDADADGRCEGVDNCDTVYNPVQTDTDWDGKGDACDSWYNCGFLDGGSVRLPDPEYTDTQLTPPPDKGMSYADLAFLREPEPPECSITRLTDAIADGLALGRASHPYPTRNPFNADDSLILVSEGTGTSTCCNHYLIDRNAYTFATPQQVQIAAGAEPVWSTTDSQILYYHTNNSLPPNHIMKYNVMTGARTIVGTINSYINFGKGEADIAADGDHLVLHLGQSYDKDWRLFTLSTGQLGPRMHDTGQGGSMDNLSCVRAVDACQVTPVRNNIICAVVEPGTFCGPYPSVKNWDGYSGLDLYDGTTGDFIRRVTVGVTHHDVGLDPDFAPVDPNAEIVVLGRWEASGNCDPGIVKVSINSSGNAVCLLSFAQARPPLTPGGPWLPWGFDRMSYHLSLNNHTGHPWVLISTYDMISAPNVGTRAYNSSLPANWQDLWGKYYNEVILLSLDGSQRFRLAHFRSRGAESDGFPGAAISMDGRHVIFDSNFALHEENPNYSDVYLLQTFFGAPPPGGSGGGGCGDHCMPNQ